MLAGIEPNNIHTIRPAAGPYGPQIPRGAEFVTSPTAMVAATPATKLRNMPQIQTKNVTDFGKRFIKT